MRIQTLFLHLVLWSAICTTSSWAQVDSVQLDGNWYYVYPFRQEINIQYDYWIAVDDEDFYADYRNYFREFDEFTDIFEAKDFYEADEEELVELNKTLKKRWNLYRKKGIRFNMGRRFVKRARENPYPFLYVKYQFDKEVIPPFQKIPDGKYVQLFEDFCLVDKDGNCQEQTPRVAAYFSIRDNALDGETVWMDVKGDTLKKGVFRNGLKEGVWEQKIFDDLPNFLYGYQLREFKKTGNFPKNYKYEMTAEYAGGVLNGNFNTVNEYFSRQETIGEYYMGKPSGNWKIYDDSTLVMNVTFADSRDTLISHRPIIRNGQQIHDDTWEHDMYSTRYQLMQIPNDFYEIAFEKELDIELEEEHFNSMELENPVRYDYSVPTRLYQNPDYWMGYNYYSIVTDPKTKYVETRGRFIDSLGAIMKYDGPYELYYPNGQLFTRYLFENGELALEDTLFWSNGVAHDVITYDTDSNYYVRTVYDTKGVQYKKLVYDTLGDFSHIYKDPTTIIKKDFDTITGTQSPFVYTYSFAFDSISGGDYHYENWSALNHEITDKTVLYQSWSGFDLSPLIKYEYDPEELSLSVRELNYEGNEYYSADKTFTPDFGSWTGSSTWKMADIEVSTISSGVLYSYMEMDTFPQRFVSRSTYSYKLAHDKTIKLDGEEYNGRVLLKMDKRKFKMSKNHLNISFTNNWRAQNRYYRKLYKHFKNGKKVKDPLFDITSSVDQAYSLNGNVYYQLFGEQLGDLFTFEYGAEDMMFDHFDRKYNRLNNIAKIKGYMKDGKPHGIWTGYNKAGKLLRQVEFIDGEPEGPYQEYYVEPRAPKWEREFSEYDLPKKNTYYLSATEQYKGGMLNGDFYNYDWNGEVVMKGAYKDDFLDGEVLERYPLAYSRTNYEEGFKDGYMRTYLTMPNMDTMLLYEINFQNDLLNGRSVAYHTNGRVAKQGFFLDGEPIEDYQAFDTLGGKYHHVKFQYGFPVEEKIWEENELSVRYLFNWEDSVMFDPSDITQTMSLQSLLYKAGYGLDYLEQEYYGRPRLINKEGLFYQMTKYYPNDTVARDGHIEDGRKIGDWDFYSYEGEHLYHVNYFDSIVVLNDTVRFKSKGIYSELSALGDTLYTAMIIEKSEKYDCAHTDHYEIRQFLTLWEANDTLGRMNGYVRNFYDNGTLQSEGKMKNGLPDGLWQYYDPFGKLNLMGPYVQGKRDGRWLSGDLGKKKYLGEICLNPDLPDLEEEIEYRENLLDVMIINYRMGKALNKQFYDLNLNKYSESSVED